MADENNEDNWESDEDDEDYVPPDGDGEGEVSDLEVSDAETEDEEDNPALANPGKKNKGKKLKKHRHNNSNDVDGNKEESENGKLKKPTTEDEKKKIDSLWADFLSDNTVASKTPLKKSSTTEKPTAMSKEILKTTPSKPNKVTVTELFEFAGETVEVQKEVDAPQAKNGSLTSDQTESTSSSNSNETNPALKRPATSKVGNILAQIGSKKSKLSVLEKTSLDWKSFKKEEGIEEDLKIHNKGKDGYLDKMAFLERTDHRQFEIEKRIRSINRSHKS